MSDGTLQIQREIDSTQLDIEQIKGDLRVLRDQTSLSTIHLDMREQGVPAASTSSVHTPSLTLGIRHAVAGFFAVLVALIVGLGYLIPIGLVAALVWIAVRWERSRKRGSTAREEA